jgi:hypothetical protein
MGNAMDHLHNHEGTGQQSSRWKWALAGFLALAAFFLWTEHRAHLFGVLPYLLILACPLVHIFHHRGHGHGHGPHRQGGSDRADRQRQVPTPGEQP